MAVNRMFIIAVVASVMVLLGVGVGCWVVLELERAAAVTFVPAISFLPSSRHSLNSENLISFADTRNIIIFCRESHRHRRDRPVIVAFIFNTAEAGNFPLDIRMYNDHNNIICQ